MKPYETFEHTADTGLRMFGGDLRELFLNAALGLSDLMTNVERIKETTSANASRQIVHRTFDLKAENIEELLWLWLREILFAFSSRRLVFFEYGVQALDETILKVQATGVCFDPATDEQRHEVKAITRHGYHVVKQNDRWVAEIIVDI
ncbi:MAG: archease [Candidatus Omnitrophica bacterium]|nr:archease [Candidatus Omnitrophota bacterium]MDD5671428.1 archease [Candidatus Omnitrophota bacterium]